MSKNRNDKKLRLHLNTAFYLMEGLKESMAVDPIISKYGSNTYYDYPREHSDESVIRRCVQLRQELLQVMKILR